MPTSPLIPLQQSPRYAKTLRHLGRSVRVLHVSDEPPVIAVARHFGPLHVSYLPRADLSGRRRDVLRRLPRAATRLIVPEEGTSLGGAYPILTPQYVAEINVPTAPVHDRLWANMHGKWRNRLRRALDGPLTTHQSDFSPRRHNALLVLEQKQSKARGYRGYPPDFLRAYAQVNHRQTVMLEALLNDQPVAFMLFLLHGAVATYAVGWTGTEGRRLSAHNLLMWEAMRSFFSKGIRRIDLGTIDTEGGRDLARFKLGCGARVRSLGSTLLVPPGFRVSP